MICILHTSTAIQIEIACLLKVSLVHNATERAGLFGFIAVELENVFG